jgi:Cystatin domain
LDRAWRGGEDIPIIRLHHERARSLALLPINVLCVLLVRAAPLPGSFLTSSPLPSALANAVAVGGLRPLSDLADPAVLNAAQAIINTHDATSNSAFSSALVGITQGSSQVVAGIKYYLTIEIAASSCLKSAASSPAECPAQSGSPHFIVDANVWSRPWVSPPDIVTINSVVAA